MSAIIHFTLPMIPMELDKSSNFSGAEWGAIGNGWQSHWEAT